MGRAVYFREGGFDVSVRAEPDANVRLGVPVPSDEYDLIRNPSGALAAVMNGITHDLAKKLGEALVKAADAARSLQSGDETE